MKADITGLQTKAVEGWEELVADCKPENFVVYIEINPEVMEKLTGTQIDRLMWKLKLVKFAAATMAAGMLKGTLKYPTDDLTVEQWMAHLIGEGADQMNYQLLVANAFFTNTKN